MNKKIVFSVGHLTNPQSNDERFPTYEQALSNALSKCNDDDVWAVWDDQTGNVEAIIYLNDVFI